MSNQDSTTKVESQRLMAQSLINGDLISVNLVATKPDSSRMSASGMFNHLGEAVDTKGAAIPSVPGLDLALLSGSAKPEFPMAKYNTLVAQGSTEAAEDLQTQYEVDLANWEAEGNQSIEDAIAAAALDWADRVHNVKTIDSGDHPVVRPENVVVKSVVRDTPEQAGVFLVQITPSWGAE